MSVKPAKIGIFFGDKPTHEKSYPKPRQEIKECRSSFGTRPSASKSAAEHHKATEDHRKTQPKPGLPHLKHTPKPLEHKPEIKPKHVGPRAHITKEQGVAHEKPHRVPTTWTDVMITTTHNWIKEILTLTNMASVNFNSEVIGKNLKLTFNAPLANSPMHEKQLFH